MDSDHDLDYHLDRGFILYLLIVNVNVPLPVVIYPDIAGLILSDLIFGCV